MSGRWWEDFESAELNSLIVLALEENFDIRSARARLAQALAEAQKAGAALYPSADGQGEASRRRTRVRTNGDDVVTEVEQYSLGLAAGYEIDLWGRVRASRMAELQEVKASREDLDAAAMTISAEVAGAWIDLLAVRQETAILHEQIAINENLLTLQRLRYENGQASALDVSQQMENLASVRSELPLLQRREQLEINLLTLLTGQAGTIGVEIRQQELPGVIDLPETGIPADILSSRPDVRAAGLRLKAADWRIAAARADRLPSLHLSAGASYSSTDFDLLFTNWVTSLAASISGPLFDGGGRRAEVERTRAVAEERLSEYAGTVAEAIREVEDGLFSEQTQQHYLVRLDEQLSAAVLAMRQARIRYLNGNSDFLNYLTGIQKVQQLQRLIVREKAELLKFRVGLYRALGGPWTTPLTESRVNGQGTYQSGGNS